MYRFVGYAELVPFFHRKSVCIVGGGPVDSSREFIDGHDVVVRVNNYVMRGHEDRVGSRCDVLYSYFGGAIKKTPDELRADGVKLLMAKCPNAKPIESEWHERNGKQNGIDFSYIFRLRERWWFGDVYVTSIERFLHLFSLLDRHIPTTGFAAIAEVASCYPRTLSLVGFDLFSSGMHNLNEKWRPGDPSDPIGHRPDLEAVQIARLARTHTMILDPMLSRVLNHYAEVAA